MAEAVPAPLVAYDFPRAECLNGLLQPAARSTAAGSGALRALPGSSGCPDGVGVRMQSGRHSAAFRSEESVAELLSQAITSQAMTVELWLRPASEPVDMP